MHCTLSLPHNVVGKIFQTTDTIDIKYKSNQQGAIYPMGIIDVVMTFVFGALAVLVAMRQLKISTTQLGLVA